MLLFEHQLWLKDYGHKGFKSIFEITWDITPKTMT